MPHATFLGGCGGRRALSLAPGSILPWHPSPQRRDDGGREEGRGGGLVSCCVITMEPARPDLTGGNNDDGELPPTTTATMMATEAFRFWSLSTAGGGVTDFEMLCRGQGYFQRRSIGGHGAAVARMAMPDASMPRTDASRDWTAVSLLPSSTAAAAVR